MISLDKRYVEGPAIAGALFLSGCTGSSSLHDTFFVATRPLDLANGFLIILTLVLAAWWLILKVSKRQPRRLFYVTLSLLSVGLLLASLPTLMLVTGIVSVVLFPAELRLPIHLTVPL